MKPKTHRWGKRINPAAAATLLDEAAIHKMLTPLHMSVELLPLGLFTEDHAETLAKLVNLVAVDSAGKGNGMWQVADAVGQVLLAMQTTYHLNQEARKQAQPSSATRTLLSVRSGLSLRLLPGLSEERPAPRSMLSICSSMPRRSSIALTRRTLSACGNRIQDSAQAVLQVTGNQARIST